MQGKVILVLSPQQWGTMRISKHHYAIALARKGNQVYYLNPPSKKWFARSSFEFRPVSEQTGLWLVDHALSFPYALKFHTPRLFAFAMHHHLRTLERKLAPIDIVWSFDLGGTYPLSTFQRARRLFHPVDEPLGNPNALRAAQGAEVIFSVTREILDNYRHTGLPRHFVNHGISDDFLCLARSGDAGARPPGPVRVGISGNLTRPDVDRAVFRQIIEENPAVVFEIWGAYEARASNIAGADDDELRALVAWLKSAPNVILHGAVPSIELPKGYARMDAFLITYDVQRDQSRGTNYHKVMEFLAAGKVVISNNITTYADRPDLVMMVKERHHNQALPALFRSAIENLDEHNSAERQRVRRQFAADNSYARQIERISEIVAGL